MPKKVFGAKINKMKEYSDGDRIGGGLKFRPAPYLPIITMDKQTDMGIVIKKGTIVSLDSNGYIVPANGGTAQDVLYSSTDIEEGVIDLDSFGATNDAVAATGDCGSDIPANTPIGVAQYDMFQWDMEADPWYQIQRNVAILEDRMVLYALGTYNNIFNQNGTVDYSGYTYSPGHWVVPDGNGYPVPITADSLAATVTVTNPKPQMVTETVTLSGDPVDIEACTAIPALVEGEYPESGYVGTFMLVSGTNTVYLGSVDADRNVDVGGASAADYTLVYWTSDVDTAIESVESDVEGVLNQLVGRVVRHVDLSGDDSDMISGFDKVIPVPGLGLPGTETDGYGDGVDATTGEGVVIQLQF